MSAIRPNAEPAVTVVSTGDGFLIDGSTGVRFLAATSVPILDASGNTVINNLITGFTSTPTAAGTTTLTVASAAVQYFTGTTTQTVVLPVVSTLALNQTYTIENASTGVLTVNSSGGNLVSAIGPGATVSFKCVAITGTSAASWSTKFDAVLAASGKVLTVSNSLTLAGTDGTVLTFPTTSATIAALGVAQVWSALQQYAQGDFRLLNTAQTGSMTLNAASAVATNVITFPAGTTDFSATGGTSQVVKQTSSGGAFTVAQLAASDLSNGTTGTGAAVLATSPTLVTPTLGVATATSINGNTWTTGTGVLTLGAGKTLTASNSLTLAGTDGTTMTFPTTSATLARTDAANTFTGTQTIGALVTTTINGNTWTAGTGVLILGAGKTLTASNSLTLVGTDGTTMTFPGTSDTVVTIAAAQTLTSKTLTTPTINGAALSGTFSGTPTLSGANFITNANRAQMAAATLKGNATAALANEADFTIQGLTNLAGPSATLDFIPIYDHVSGTIKNVTPGAIATSAVAGVSSLNGLTGALALRPVGVQNAKIAESHTGNAATFALKTLAGADPSAGDPVFATFPDGSELAITAALSVTIPSTGTLGTTSAVPFRLWFALVNSSGTPYLAVRNCSDPNGTYGFPGVGLLSTTIITTPNSSGVAYTSTAVTSKPFVILGFATYESGMATAGTWVTSPSSPVLYIPGMPKPGDPTGNNVQFSTVTTLTNATASYVNSALTTSITPSSAANLVATLWSGNMQISNAGVAAFAALRRGGSIIGSASKMYTDNATNYNGMMGGSWMDSPGSSGAVTYVVSTELGAATGSCAFMNAVSPGVLQLSEIMG